MARRSGIRPRIPLPVVASAEPIIVIERDALGDASEVVAGCGFH
jgi:hypothetical protein